LSFQSGVPDGAVFLAVRVALRGFTGALNVDTFDAVFRKEPLDALMDELPHGFPVCISLHLQPDRQFVVVGLVGLEALHAPCFFDDRAKCERKDRHRVTAPVEEAEGVIVATLNVDSGKGTAARTRVGIGRDAVAEVVADDGLDAVCQVGEEHGIAGLAGRRRRAISLNRFQDEPIRVGVEPSLPAVEGNPVEELAGGILIKDARIEGVLNRASRVWRENSSANDDEDRSNAEAARFASSASSSMAVG